MLLLLIVLFCLFVFIVDALVNYHVNKLFKAEADALDKQVIDVLEEAILLKKEKLYESKLH